MPMDQRSRAALSFFWSAMALTCAVLAAMTQAETFSATASLKTAGGTQVSSPVSITVNTFPTSVERDALLAAIKGGGTKSARDWMSKRPSAGTLQVGARKVDIKYAYRTPLGSGSLITLGAGEPLVLVGAGMPGAKPATGYDLALLLLQMPASGPGTGELSPAAKLRIDDKGAIVTEDFNSAELVRLTGVTKK